MTKRSPAAASPSAIEVAPDNFGARTFLLGNGAGFVLYQPVSHNVADSTLLPIKWFGASAFGRKYLEAVRLWLVTPQGEVKLDRSNQVGFRQELDRAVRTFAVNGETVTQTLFVPHRLQAFVMTVEAAGGQDCLLEPQFDMRYYQAFNTDLSCYEADQSEPGVLRVRNRVSAPTPTSGDLDFFAAIGAQTGRLVIEPLCHEQQFCEKVYLHDERRERLIEAAYKETEAQSPDEAPIWNTYSTTVFVPARLRGTTPLTIICAFADAEGEAEQTLHQLRHSLAGAVRAKRQSALRLTCSQTLTTGNTQVDRAAVQVETRWDTTLVARDTAVRTGQHHLEHFYAIFAGNKYFLDAWKRDENISLEGLLLMGDFETVRAILNETWSHQDQRTGRLPHIIQMGEPLVYYSSDGTLWALRRLHDYLRATGDRSLLDEKYPMVERFFLASLDFVQRGLLPSGGIIDPSYRWETWEDTPYTPRDGYPVEIELLWLTNLASFLPEVERRTSGLGERLRTTLDEGRHSFELFYLDGYLADSLDYSWQPRRELTPNGYMAFGLDFPLPADLARSMVLLARDQLAGARGIKGLATRDWPNELSAAFLADPENVRGNRMASVGLYNYHRGIEWLWLNQFFVKGELLYGDADRAYDTYVRGLVHAALYEGGVGGLGELYDLHGPLGADFQSWSMVNLIACLHAFAGIDVDEPGRRVSVCALPPAVWPRLSSRRRIGDHWVELTCRQSGAEEWLFQIQNNAGPGYRLRLATNTAVARGSVAFHVNGRAHQPAYGEPAPGAGLRASIEVPLAGPIEARVRLEPH